jgi:signal transduction histidine kinase/DNA-binding response OmpR family regulator
MATVLESASAPDWLAGDGELVRMIRDKDWSRTPLGPIERWPQSLRTAVSLCLGSNFPINIIWGAEHTQIYNDSYRVCCGDAHPRALGENYRFTWASAWPAIGESFERALAGETMYVENRRMFLKRLGGALEETFFTFSHSSIHAEDGGIGGLFHPVTETTATMLAERRTRALRDLASMLASTHDEAELARRTAEVIARFEFDLPFALYYTFDPATSSYRLVGSHGIALQTPATPAAFDADTSAPWPFADALAARRSVEVDGLGALLAGVRCGPYEEPPRRALVVPIVVPGAPQPPALMVVGASPRLRFNDDYRSFYDLLGVTIANALATVRAREDERRRTEALAQIDRAKTLFFSNVSHEFRTPLTLMLGPLEQALGNQQQLSLGLREDITIAHRNALRLLKLVNMLLDFARIESGRMEASFEPVHLASLTAELASNFRSAIEHAGMRLVIDCPVLPEPVWVDREMWEKIVLNLLSNAFKFTFEGEIAVRVSLPDAQHAQMSVSDTGTGIEPHEIAHVFERFHRNRGARARSHEGSGIGLALVQELVKLHGGSIAVASTPGQGTTFTVRIPTGSAHLPKDRLDASYWPSSAVSANAFVEEALRWLPDPSYQKARSELHGTARTDVAAEPAATQVKRASILVADDNADMRAYARHLLEADYDVQTVADGDSALRLVRERMPDLIVADIMMPGVDGLELLRALRADPQTRPLPFILLAARAGEESRVEGLDAGADDYLVKPFSARELLARVKAHVGLAQERRRAADALSARLVDLEKANAEIRDARRATLNVLEDAVESRNRAERLYAELDDYARWTRGQREALEAAVNEAPLEESLGALVRTADVALGQSARAAIYLVDDEGTIVRHAVGMSADYVQAMDALQMAPDSFARQLNAHAREPLFCADVFNDPGWERWRALAARFGYRGSWMFPVNTAARNLVGALAIYSHEPREITSRDLQLVVRLTNTASIILSRQKESEGRRQFQAAHRRSEQQLHAYLAASFDVVYRMNPDWTEMRQLEGKSFIVDTLGPSGTWLDRYIHPDDQAQVLEAIRVAVETKSIFELEHRVLRVDGTLGWTLSRAVPLLDEDGQIIEWLGMATDVTARRQSPG